MTDAREAARQRLPTRQTTSTGHACGSRACWRTLRSRLKNCPTTSRSTCAASH
jgi:hypothetical protein